MIYFTAGDLKVNLKFQNLKFLFFTIKIKISQQKWIGERIIFFIIILNKLFFLRFIETK